VGGKYRVVQIKTTIRYTILLRMANKKMIPIPSDGKDVEKLDTLLVGM
jgi:hypothetical protein